MRIDINRKACEEIKKDGEKMKRSKILLEKEEERKDDLMEYLESKLLSYEDIDEFNEEREDDLMEYLELLSYIEDDEEERIDEFEEEDLME